MIGKQVLAFGKSEKYRNSQISGFLLPRLEGVKGGAISGGLRQIGRDHMYGHCLRVFNGLYLGYPTESTNVVNISHG